MKTEDYIRLLEPVNFDKYCEAFLRIQTKSKGLRPLVLNPAQMRMQNEWMSILDEDRPRRIIILKARQQGFSTFTEALCYKETSSQYDFRSAVISHMVDSTRKLYRMFKLYYNMFPAHLKPVSKTRGNAYEMNFNLLRSSINVLTAGSPLSSSGGTYQFVHVSELSKWRDAATAMDSLMQTVPDDATVIIESTAFGVGGVFYDMWHDAVNGKSEYTPMFFPWFEHPEYLLPLAKGEFIEPNRAERYYVDRFGEDVITPERLKWLRRTLTGKCRGSWDTFRQEYPAYAEEAFIASGRPVFDMDALQKRELAVRKANAQPVMGDLMVQKDDKRKRSVTWVEGQGGMITVYDKPVGGDKLYARRYVIAADVSEGIDRHDEEGRADNTDWNFVTVWDRLKCSIVAYSRNKLDPDQFAMMLYALQIWYGNGIDKSNLPLLIVERNGPGLSVLMYLRDYLFEDNIPLNRMYHRGPMDVNYEPSTELLGFRTTVDTKQGIIGEMMRRVREGEDGIPDLAYIDEAKVFVRDEKGRMRAQRGLHDDAVMSLALAYEGARADFPPEIVKKPRILTGWRAELFKKPMVNVGYWSVQ